MRWLNWSRAVLVVACVGLCPSAFAQVSVPQVGCPSGGQVDGPPAPVRPPVELAIDQALAARIAVYRAADGPAVIAPRGWQCYTEGGSGGIVIRVMPRLPEFGSADWRGSRGPAVVSAFFFADTSGRDLVAAIDARLFPKHATFIAKVTAFQKEIGAKPRPLAEGPHADDRMTQIARELLAFETRVQGSGMGEYAAMKPSHLPTRGLVKNCGDEDGVYVLATRLPPDLQDLAETLSGPRQQDQLLCAKQRGS